MAKADEQVQLGNKLREQVYLGTEILEPEDIYNADPNYNNELDDNDYGEREAPMSNFVYYRHGADYSQRRPTQPLGRR